MRRRDQLERIVDDFDGAVLMVSHDRHLLDACVGAIASSTAADSASGPATTARTPSPASSSSSASASRM